MQCSETHLALILRRPPGPGCFLIDSPKPTGYQVSLFSVSETVSNSLRSLGTKLTTSQKLKIAKLSKVLNPFQNITHILGQKENHNIPRTLNDHISKNKNRKNRKIDFKFDSEHCATFLEQKPNLVTFE